MAKPTKITGGLSVDGVPTMGMNLGALTATQGDVYFVKPRTGSDENTGKSVDNAFKTLAQALSAATANQNDIVFLISEHNDTAGSTTDYQSTTLDWNKDMVHLIGVNAGNNISPRSRVAFLSTYDTASNLFTLSADNCLIANIQFFAGVAGVNPTGAFLVTGDRNRVVNCHIAGIGNDANDIAGAYSIKLDTASENQFEQCTIGVTTTGAGSAANSDILVDGGSARNRFISCYFTRRVDHASNFVFVKLADATAIEDFLSFDSCRFIPTSTNYAIAMGAVMDIPALTQGFIQVIDSVVFKSDNSTAPVWDVNNRDKIQVMGNPTPAAETVSVARQV